MLILNTLVTLVFAASITYVSATTYTCARNQGCGCSKYDTTTMNARIVGGETAAVGTWGWAASIYLNAANPNFCGGSVINEKYILTAAHCVADLEKHGYSIYDTQVRVGLNVISSPGPNVEIYRVEAATIHPSYDKNNASKGYDIAVLKLSGAIDFSRNTFISKVCLPFINSTPPADLANPEYPLPNKNLVAIGWGVTSEGSRPTSNTLQQVTVQALDKDNSKCRFPPVSPWPGQNNNPQIQMCASAPYKGKLHLGIHHFQS